MSADVTHIELKWHLALFIARLHLSNAEPDLASSFLFEWLGNKNESNIVRVNALQSLVDLSNGNPQSKKRLIKLLPTIISEQIPSLNTRKRKLKLL